MNIKFDKNDYDICRNYSLFGTAYNDEDFFEFFIKAETNLLWAITVALGYDQVAVRGIAKSILSIYRYTKRRYWVAGYQGTTELIIELLVTENTQLEPDKKIATSMIKVISCLVCFDRALVAYKRHKEDDCLDWVRSGQGILWELKYKEEFAKNIISENARKNALTGLARDPKQLALKEITKNYKLKISQFKRRAYTAQFVREMHNKYPVITEQKTIANLVTRLNKENELLPR